MFKTSGITLLETIVSYKPPTSLSEEKWKTVHPVPVDTSTTALVSFPLFCTAVRQSKRIE